MSNGKSRIPNIETTENHYLYFDFLPFQKQIINLNDDTEQPVLLCPKFLDIIYEAELIKYFFGLDLPTGTFIDVGAHVGSWTIAMAKKYRNVYSFEPSEFQFAYLARNVELNKLSNVKISPKAVGNKAGSATLFVMGRSGGGNTIKPDVAALGMPMYSMNVPVIKLDDEDIDQVSLIKIDVEGGENEVIEGAKILIAKHQPIIICESWTDEKRRNEFEQLMNSIGYNCNFDFKDFPEMAICKPR